MRKIRRIALSLVLAVLMLVGLAVPALAGNPTVSITVTARVISITNSVNEWAIGVVTLSQIVYFSATGEQNNIYSQITNTGSVTVDVEIQGTDFVATNTSYNWVLGSTNSSEQYCLYANSEATPTVYDIEVTTGGTPLVSSLIKDDTNDWSMKFTAPSAFDASDDGEPKAATVTLVASV